MDRLRCALPETKRLMYGVRFFGYINPKISSHFRQLQFTMVFTIWYFRFSAAQEITDVANDHAVNNSVAGGKSAKCRQPSSPIYLIIITIHCHYHHHFAIPSPILLRVRTQPRFEFSSFRVGSFRFSWQIGIDAKENTICYFMHNYMLHSWININRDVTCKQALHSNFYIYQEY